MIKIHLAKDRVYDHEKLKELADELKALFLRNPKNQPSLTFKQSFQFFYSFSDDFLDSSEFSFFGFLRTVQFEIFEDKKTNKNITPEDVFLCFCLLGFGSKTIKGAFLWKDEWTFEPWTAHNSKKLYNSNNILWEHYYHKDNKKIFSRGLGKAIYSIYNTDEK